MGEGADISSAGREEPRWFKVLSVLVLPTVLGVVGFMIEQAVKDSEIRVRYSELAVNVLSKPPVEETRALRDWAIDLLDSQSPIKLSQEAKMQLKSFALPVVVNATAPGGTGTGAGSATWGKASGNGVALGGTVVSVGGGSGGQPIGGCGAVDGKGGGSVVRRDGAVAGRGFAPGGGSSFDGGGATDRDK